MAQLFEDERKYPDNKQRVNFVFLGYPYSPPIALEDYRNTVAEIEAEIPVRLWYFLDEITTAEMMRKIWRAILRADLCIFDISGGNPNVAFELGLAVATNRSCMTILKTGELNPLGTADLGYSERQEYTSVESLKTCLLSIIHSRSSAWKLANALSYDLYDEELGQSREEIENSIREIIKKVYVNKRISKTQAQSILFRNRKLADRTLSLLREKDVLQVVGQKKGAKWVLSDSWVNKDHEVVGD